MTLMVIFFQLFFMKVNILTVFISKLLRDVAKKENIFINTLSIYLFIWNQPNLSESIFFGY